MPVMGADYSFWNGRVDFKKAKAAGVRFVFIRAGQGEAIDPYFEINWAAAKAEGLLRGSYWFYEPTVSPQRQAELYVSVHAGDYGELPMVCDIEKSGGAYFGWTFHRVFIDTVSIRTHHEVMIYTGPYFWKDQVVPPLSEYTYIVNKPLWIAHYGAPTPMIPAPWSSWEFWQYTDKANSSIYGTSDLDWYNGTDSQLYLTYGQVVPVPTGDEFLESQMYFDGLTIEHWLAHLPHGDTHYYVAVVAMEKADFFVSPQPVSRTYVPKYVANYGLDFAVNGDGWTNDPQTGAIIMAGWECSEGKPYGRTGIEQTIHFPKDGGISLARPTSLWNAISFPNQIIKDGQPTLLDKSLDDIRARTCFGWNDTHAFFLWVDGGDYWVKAGMNYVHTQERLMQRGCKQAVWLDGGGSTTSAVRYDGAVRVIGVPSGEDLVDGLHMRRVANVLGVRMKSTPLPPQGEPIVNRYTATSWEERSLRSDHNVFAGTISKIAAGAVMGGEEVWTATSDGVYVKAGDQWLHVLTINGVAIPKPGWTAITHLGKPQADLIDNEGTPTPPPLVVTHVIEVTNTGELIIDDVPYVP